MASPSTLGRGIGALRCALGRGWLIGTGFGRTRTLAPRRRNCFEPRNVAKHLAHSGSIFQLPAGALKAQVEVLLFELEHFVVDLIDRHRSDIGWFHDAATRRCARRTGS